MERYPLGTLKKHFGEDGRNPIRKVPSPAFGEELRTRKIWVAPINVIFPPIFIRLVRLVWTQVVLLFPFSSKKVGALLGQITCLWLFSWKVVRQEYNLDSVTLTGKLVVGLLSGASSLARVPDFSVFSSSHRFWIALSFPHHFLFFHLFRACFLSILIWLFKDSLTVPSLWFSWRLYSWNRTGSKAIVTHWNNWKVAHENRNEPEMRTTHRISKTTYKNKDDSISH